MQTIQQYIKYVVRQDILNSQAYTVQDRRGYIALDAMESPFEWQDQEGIGALFSQLDIHRYPGDKTTELKQKFKQYLNIDKSQDIIFGNGSDEILQMLCTLVGASSKVLSLAPSFSMYKVLAQQAQLDFLSCDLKQDLAIDIHSLLQIIEQYQPKLIFIASPNNPTGQSVSRQDIESVIRASQGLIVLDQAYQWFVGDLATELLDYPNVVITSTFSKVGLAGLRFGFLIGHLDWVEQIDKIRLPYNMSSLTQQALFYALNHMDWIKNRAKDIVVLRQELVFQLKQIKGIEILPSDANFILMRLKHAQTLQDKLKKSGILVKNLHNTHPLCKDCLRVSIGSHEDNKMLINAIRQSI